MRRKAGRTSPNAGGKGAEIRRGNGGAALLGFAASAAFLTPAASTPAAVTFGNTEWTTMKEAYRASISGSACCVIIMIGLGVPLAIAVFGLHLQ